MKPQVGTTETNGAPDTPLHNDVEGLSDCGEEWGAYYSGLGSGTMAMPGEEALWEEITALDKMSDRALLSEVGIELIMSTMVAAEYFDRTTQWLYWGLNPDPETGEVRFVWEDGSPIVPERVNNRRRFTTKILLGILKSCYRRGNINDSELTTIFRRIRYTELGAEWREREGWKRVYLGRKRYRWVKPEHAHFDQRDKTWKLRK